MGSFWPAAIWALAKASPKIVGDAHDFSGGTHFWARTVSTPGISTRGRQAIHVEERPSRSVPRSTFWKELTQLAPGHQPAAILPLGLPWLGNEGHGREARGLTSST